MNLKYELKKTPEGKYALKRKGKKSPLEKMGDMLLNIIGDRVTKESGKVAKKGGGLDADDLNLGDMKHGKQ